MAHELKIQLDEDTRLMLKAVRDEKAAFRTKDLFEEINNIISELPPKAREAVELRLIKNLSPKEAAQKTGCSVDRFYDRFHEGLKILKEKILT